MGPQKGEKYFYLRKPFNTGPEAKNKINLVGVNPSVENFTFFFNFLTLPSPKMFFMLQKPIMWIKFIFSNLLMVRCGESSSELENSNHFCFYFEYLMYLQVWCMLHKWLLMSFLEILSHLKLWYTDVLMHTVFVCAQSGSYSFSHQVTLRTEQYSIHLYFLRS